MTNRRLIQLSAIFAPILVIFAWIISLSAHTNSEESVYLEIRGFDPRDLLSGHYLQYRVDYGKLGQCQAEGERCLCLKTGADRIAKAYKQGNCSDLDCPLLLRGNCRGQEFTAGIERFYFSETLTKQLAVVPPKAAIEVALSREGRGIVKDMIVDGRPLADWLEINAKTSDLVASPTP